MIKREYFNCSIKDVSEELELLYELYPQFRGYPPNRVFNIAVKEWLKQQLTKKEIIPFNSSLFQNSKKAQNINKEEVKNSREVGFFLSSPVCAVV